MVQDPSHLHSKSCDADWCSLRRLSSLSEGNGVTALGSYNTVRSTLLPAPQQNDESADIPRTAEGVEEDEVSENSEAVGTKS